MVNARRCEGTREAPSHTGPELSARRTSICVSIAEQCDIEVKRKRIVMMAHVT